MTQKWFKRRNKCPACSVEDFRNIYENRYDENPIKEYLENFYVPQGMIELEYLLEVSYILCECENCGLIFQRDIPNAYLMERLYEHWIDPKIVFKQQSKNSLNYYSLFAQEIAQIIAFFGKKPSSLEVFDFGMGWGKWALMAKAFGCNSYGAELSINRVKYAKENGIKIVSWEEIPQYQFDFINTEQVFEHISDPLETLCYLKSALKTNGILKISVPNAKNIDRRLELMDWSAGVGSKSNLNAVAPLEHINCFRRPSLDAMAAKAQMEEVVIPVKLQYRFIADWGGPKKIFKNIIRPISKNMLKRENYIFLRKLDRK